MRLLIVTWRSPQCRIPDDKQWIAKRLRLEPLQYDGLIKPIIDEFFMADADAHAGARFLTQKRLKKEWNYTSEKREKNKAAAKSRWEKEKEPCERISKRNAPTPSPTPSPTKTPLPPKGGAPAARGGLNFGKGEGGAAAPFNIDPHLSDDDRLKARQAAPGWDIYFLMRTYNESVSSGRLDKPRYPARHFVAWCASYTKGKQP